MADKNNTATRPSYDRRSKLLFFEKMFNCQEIYAKHSAQSKKENNKRCLLSKKIKLPAGKLLKKRKKLELPVRIYNVKNKSDSISSGSISCAENGFVSTYKTEHITEATDDAVISILDGNGNNLPPNKITSSGEIIVSKSKDNTDETIDVAQNENNKAALGGPDASSGGLHNNKVLENDLSGFSGKQEQNNKGVTVFAYKCQKCQKGFAAFNLLQDHSPTECSKFRKTKQKSKPRDKKQSVSILFSCHVCSRTFVKSKSLVRHYNKHFSPRDACILPNKLVKTTHEDQSTSHFVQQTVLSNHEPFDIDSSSENRHFICRVCDKHFAEQMSFLNHFRSHHYKTSQSATSGNNLHGKISQADQTINMHDKSEVMNPEEYFISSSDFQNNQLNSQKEVEGSLKELEKKSNNAAGSSHSKTKRNDMNVNREPLEYSQLSVKLKTGDNEDCENSRISIKIGGFEIEIDHPADDVNGEKMAKNDTSENKFICKVCSKSFSNCIQLTRHNTIHKIIPEGKNTESHLDKDLNEKTKPYSCPECRKSFSTVLRFRYHIKTHGKMSYCATCGILVSSLENLMCHIKEHKKKENSCKSSELKNETKIDGNKCKICLICSKSFISAYGFKQHMARHGFKKYCPRLSKTKTKKVKKLSSKYVASKQSESKDVKRENDISVHSANSDLEENKNEFNPISVRNSCNADKTDFTHTINSPYDDDADYNLDDSDIQTSLVISNTFSLTKDNSENVDILTRLECQLAIEQEEHFSKQVPESSLTNLHNGMTKDDIFIKPVKQVTDVSVLNEQDKRTDCETDSSLNATSDSDSCFRKDELSENQAGQLTHLCLVDKQEMKTDNNNDITDVKISFPQLGEHGRPTGQSSVKMDSDIVCEICSKIMPTLAFKRIHLLLHKKVVKK